MTRGTRVQEPFIIIRQPYSASLPLHVVHSALSHLCKFLAIGNAGNTNLVSHHTIQTTLLNATKSLVAAITLVQVVED